MNSRFSKKAQEQKVAEQLNNFEKYDRKKNQNSENPPFQTQIYLVKVSLNVNIVKQDLLNKKQFLKNL